MAAICNLACRDLDPTTTDEVKKNKRLFMKGEA